MGTFYRKFLYFQFWDIKLLDFIQHTFVLICVIAVKTLLRYFVVFVLGAMMFYHYIKIVPTTYVRADGSTLLTNQFSVTRHARQVSLFSGESGMPGIFFNYELSPLMVKYTEKAKSFGHFATNACAIIGGVFTVAGLIDSLLYHSVRAIQKKIELGKYN